MNSFRQIITVICFFVIIFGLYAMENFTTTKKNPLVDQSRIGSFDIRNGKKLFSQYCAPCHGENGNGDGIYYGYELEPKPADFTDREFFVSHSKEDIKKVIGQGSGSVGKSNLCPPWEGTLHKEAIASIVGYLEVQFKK